MGSLTITIYYDELMGAHNCTVAPTHRQRAGSFLPRFAGANNAP